MNMDDATLDDLASRIARRLAPAIRKPSPDDWLTADETAEYLRSKAGGRIVLERWSKYPGFPAPSCPTVPGGQRARKLWRRSDLDEYLKKHRRKEAQDESRA